ncbi:MAG TPA: hypothetical protein VKO63_12940 [Chitinispirillaceae bacterium]|nr:hypothetical protein [Chitinispirillaceae bacterium]
MAISAELRALIDGQMAALSKKEIQKPNMAMNTFTNNFSGLLAQMETDLDKLIAAGFNGANTALYRAYLEALLLAHGERRGVLDISPEKKQVFDTEFPKAEADKKRLLVVGRHIAENSKYRADWKAFQNIAEGSGTIDTLNDNVALVPMIKENPALASQVRPGGFAITNAYLDEVLERSVRLLMMKGYIVENGVPQNDYVDKQYRLVTLCRRAITDIKKYGNIAFYDDKEYYESNYTFSSGTRSDVLIEESTEPATAAQTVSPQLAKSS